MAEEPDLLLDREDLQSKEEGVCPGEQSWLVQGQARPPSRGCGWDERTAAIVRTQDWPLRSAFCRAWAERAGEEGERGRDFLRRVVRMPPCESVPCERVFATCETRRKRLGEA